MDGRDGEGNGAGAGMNLPFAWLWVFPRGKLLEPIRHYEVCIDLRQWQVGFNYFPPYGQQGAMWNIFFLCSRVGSWWTYPTIEESWQEAYERCLVEFKQLYKDPK